MPDPRIVPIDEWGGTRNGWPGMDLPAVGIWVHHSVTTATDDAYADFRALDSIGISHGHNGVSYSFVVHPNGTIGEGQGGARGAHTGGNGCNGSGYGWNPCSFGVCFVGNYMDDVPTDTAIRSFQWLKDHLAASGWLRSDFTIEGHRNAPGNSTACPGNNLEDIIPRLREPYNPNSNPVEDDDMKAFALKKPGEERVWLCWGMYKTAIPNMDVLSGLQYLGTCGPVADGVPSFIDGLVEIPWGIAPGAPSTPGGPIALSEADKNDIAVRVANLLSSRLQS